MNPNDAYTYEAPRRPPNPRAERMLRNLRRLEAVMDDSQASAARKLKASASILDAAVAYWAGKSIAKVDELLRRR